MTFRVIVPSKTVSEEFDITFPFQAQLEFGETIIGYNISCGVQYGVDPNPSAVLMGAAIPDPMNIVQRVHGGLLGVTYEILCVVAGSDGGTYSTSCYLAIVNPL